MNFADLGLIFDEFCGFGMEFLENFADLGRMFGKFCELGVDFGRLADWPTGRLADAARPMAAAGRPMADGVLRIPPPKKFYSKHAVYINSDMGVEK